MTFDLVHFSRRENGRFTRRWGEDRRPLDVVRAMWKRSPDELFVSVQRYAAAGDSREDAHLCPVYADMDAPDVRVSLRWAIELYDSLGVEFDIGKEHRHLYFSGAKGAHLEIPPEVFGLRPRPDLSRVVGRFVADHAERFLGWHRGGGQLDPSVYSVPRLWRLAGSRHASTGLFKVEISRPEAVRIVTVSDADLPGILRAIAGAPREPLYEDPPAPADEAVELWASFERWDAEEQERLTATSRMLSLPTAARGEAPVCVRHVLEHGLELAGKRNLAALSLGTFYAAQGLPEAEATHRIHEWECKVPAGLTSTTNPRALLSHAQSVVACAYHGDRRGRPYRWSCGAILSSGPKGRIPCVGSIDCPWVTDDPFTESEHLTEKFLREEEA